MAIARWSSLALSLLVVLLPVSLARKDTCEAIQNMTMGMINTLGSEYNCTTISCDGVSCATSGDSPEKIEVRILMCQDPPGVQLSASAETFVTTTFTFNSSSNTTAIPGGKLSATLLEWNSDTEIFGIEIQMFVFGSNFTLVPRSEVPISCSDRDTEEDAGVILAVILGVLLTFGVIVVALMLCGIPLGAFCCSWRQRKEKKRQQLVT